MPEKYQHTKARLELQMYSKYGNDVHHKHNKWHSKPYRQHWKSHPVRIEPVITDDMENTHHASGAIRHLNLKKIRTRLNKNRYH